MAYKYLFGPVPSRRLGLSLGIDLIPYKVCNLNCVYCESGKTTKQTNRRDHFVDIKEVIAELKDILSPSPKLDFLTFSGAGEPTLNKGLGKIISIIKQLFPQYKTALITNSVLFTDKELWNEVLSADVILPSLDAVSQQVFEKINRPLQGIFSSEIIESLVSFRNVFKGQIWLEVFLLPGINDDEKELMLLKAAIEKMKVDKLHLNTLDRPGTESLIKGLPHERMIEIKHFFHPLPVEIASRMHAETLTEDQVREGSTLIAATLKRRPCTLDDLRIMTSLGKEKLEAELKKLLRKGVVKTEWQGDILFYVLK